jgi:signal transduction histidine kinase/CheY-like chemotaxis protein
MGSGHLLGFDKSRSCPFPVADLGLASSQSVVEIFHESGSHQDVHIREIEKDGHILEIHRVDLPTGGFVKTIADITRKKAIQRDIEDARDRAEAASRARAAFLATMSHEIRTPLSGVISMADLLSQTQLDRDQRWYTHVARESAEHLLQLLDDILDISKFEAGRLTLETISFELPHLVQNVLEMLGPKARGKGLAFGCHIEPSLPKRIMGDPGRLRQILINLIGNAVKFTSHGHVMIRVAQAMDANGQPSLRFDIEDTGIGISEKGIASLFQDFSQLDDSISRRFGGSGLGLSICKKLVTKMGGSIDVTSEVGKGATFTFVIPLNRDENANDPAIKSLADCAVAVLASCDFERSCLVTQLQSCGATTLGFGDLETVGPWLAQMAARGGRAPVLICVGPLAEMQSWRLANPDLDKASRRLLVATAELAINRDDTVCAGFDDVLVTPVAAEGLAEAILRTSQPAGAAAPATSTARSSMDAKLEYKVLLAVDNATNQFAITRILEKLGASVTVVENGELAVRAVQQEHYDFVLMDMMMPIMDGLSAARGIRALPEPTCSIPIIALTANAFPEDREATRLAGMNGFTTKPTTGARLRAAIEDVMGAREVVQKPVEAPVQAAATQAEEDHAQSAIDNQTFDALREELGDEEFQEALDIFLDDVHQRLRRMASGDAKAIQSECHALKSSSAMFGMGEFASQCAAMEKTARDGGSFEAEGLKRLQSMFEQAQRQVRQAA